MNAISAVIVDIISCYPHIRHTVSNVYPMNNISFTEAIAITVVSDRIIVHDDVTCCLTVPAEQVNSSVLIVSVNFVVAKRHMMCRPKDKNFSGDAI